eukprot:366353-Chlamydomonas_euryale.AAC.9
MLGSMQTLCSASCRLPAEHLAWWRHGFQSLKRLSHGGLGGVCDAFACTCAPCGCTQVRAGVETRVKASMARAEALEAELEAARTQHTEAVQVGARGLG